MKEGSGNITANSASKTMRQALLVVQFGLAFIILTSAALVSLSLYRLNNEDAGFDGSDVLSVDMTLNFTAFQEISRRRDFLRYLEARLVNHPQILAVGASSQVPLAGSPNLTQQFQIEGQPPIDSAQRLSVITTSASADFHRVMRIPLINGRYLEDSDDENGVQVVLINQAMADRHFTGRNAVGRRLSFNEGGTWLEIVGVVGNVKSEGLDAPPSAVVYTPYLQELRRQNATANLRLFVQAETASQVVKDYISETIHFFEPKQAVRRIVEMDVIRDSWLSSPRLVSQLIAIFALLALGITLSGVVGVVAYNISQRMREIGIRIALGANPRNIRSMLIKQGMLLGLLGLCSGGIIVMFAAPLLGEVLFDTSPADIVVYLSSAIVISLMAVLAIVIPTRQVVGLDPSQALRDQ